MSLDWSTANCYPPLPTDENDRVLQEALVMGMMAIGQRGITDRNLDEVVLRLSVLEKLGSALRNRPTNAGFEPVYLTYAEVERWVGLSTNVSDESRASFLKRMVNGLERDLRYAKRCAAEQVASEPATV